MVAEAPLVLTIISKQKATMNLNLVQINRLSDSELKTLLESGEDVRVSIIMPVQQETDKRTENRIRLKNLLQAAEEKLAALDYRPPDIERLLAPAEEMAKGGRFLATDSPGLAIYLAQGFAQAYQLPFAPEKVVTVGPDFLIKPLMSLHKNRHFYILALSQKAIRLLKATQYHVERLELHEMPQSLAEALRWDDPERELQWHSQTSSGADTPQAAMFHGHGVGSKEVHKENLLRYFQLLDQGIDKLLVNENAPLVLAGVDYLLPIYREANTYDPLIEESIVGSHEQLSDTELQRQAWKLIRPYFRQEREQAVALYQQQAGRALASADLTTVVPAAHRGRVGTLFVAADEQVWGTYDPHTNQLDLHSQAQPGDSDLLNLTAIHTVLNSGEVYVSHRNDVPGAEPAAAIFRY